MKEFKYIRLYSELYFKYGLNEFDINDLDRNIKSLEAGTPINILLERLCRKGYLERISRGRYRVIHPNILLLESIGYDWRSRIKPEYRPMLELVIAKFIEYFREKLISIILFGSLARGTVKEYSDIDLLVVADPIPQDYSDRVKIVSRIIDEVGGVRLKLWRDKGIYPLIDVILLNRDEAKLSHPFYLDMVRDAIIIYDKDSFMEKRIDSIRRRLDELGSVRVQLPNGRYYWILKPGIKWGEIIEL